MSASPKTKIWILEDHEAFAKQIRRLLNGEEDMECPYHFAHPDDLFDKLRFSNERPDIMLLDLGLPRRDGLEVLGELRSALPNIKVIILSAFDDRERVYRAICNGASGYLLKTADPDDIVSGIREVINGAAALSGSLAKMILEGFASHGPVQQIETLTAREEDVLRLLVRGMIKKEIADELEISQHTVDMHLRSVYRKLQVRSQTEAVSKALRQGDRLKKPFKEEMLNAAAFLFEQANGNVLSDYELEELAWHGVTGADTESIAADIRQTLDGGETTESFRSAAYWALGKRLDRGLLPFFRSALKLEVSRDANATYQIMIALDNLGEPIFLKARNGSHSILDSERNLTDATAYLDRLATSEP